MKILNSILFILILSTATATATAYAEKYVIENPDGSVRIADYREGSNDTLEEFLKSVGSTDKVYKINDVDIPSGKEDRKYWKRSGNKVVVDQEKKQSDIDVRSVKESQKSSVFEKLKISKKEFDVIRDVE